MFEDLKFAWRRLRSAPGFASVAILTLALAIGANVAIFSIADAVLFRPLPYADAGQVDVLLMRDRSTGQQFTNVSLEYLEALRDNAAALGISDSGLLEQAASVVAAGPDGPESVPVMAATPNYLEILGVRPYRGRLFAAEDAREGGRAALLSYEAWQKRFAGREDIVGRPLVFGAKTFDLIGILPPKLMLPAIFGTKPEIVTATAPPARGEKGGSFYPIVRRNAGLTREQVQPRIDAVTQAISNRNPRTVNAGPSLQEVRSVMFPVGRPIMKWLFAASSFVLLIGCANLANMLLARSHRNQRAIGIAIALGATRMRVIRPLLFESAIIGVAGAGIALVVTSIAFDTLLKQVPRGAYGPAPVGVDLRVSLIALSTGLLAGLLFAAVPAWRSFRRDVQALLQRRLSNGRAGGRFGRPMVVVQVALAVMLIFGAAVTTRAFVAVLQIPLGFDDRNVIRLGVSGNGLRGAALQEHYAGIVQKLSERTDIASAGATGRVPLGGSAPDEGVRLPGSESMAAGIVHTLPGMFETLGVGAVRGRLLTPDDLRNDPDAAVVSEGAARVLFPGRDPIGQRFDNGRGRSFHVIGVVPDIKYSLGPRPDQPSTYAFPGAATRQLTIFARARSRDEATIAGIKRDIGAITPGVPVSATWWSESISGIADYKNPRFQTIVLGSFAVLALGLTALGIFGVVAFLVAMRTREMGVRLAIGARPSSLVALVVRQSTLPVLFGIAAGVVATKYLAKLAEAQLFAVKTDDPTVLAGAAIVVYLAAVIAAYLPARQAARVDPVIVLRAE